MNVDTVMPNIQQRIEVFKRLVLNKRLNFSGVYVHDALLSFPRVSKKKNRTSYKLLPPFSVNSRKKYKLPFNGEYYDLYKNNKSFSFIKLDNESFRTDELIKEFSCTIYYSYFFCFVYDMVGSLIKEGYKVKVRDEVYNPLLEHLSSQDSELEFLLTWYPIDPSEIVDDNKIFYLSIFN